MPGRILPPDQITALIELSFDPEGQHRKILSIESIVARSMNAYLNLAALEADLEAHPEFKIVGRRDIEKIRRSYARSIKKWIGHTPTVEDLKRIIPKAATLAPETLDALGEDLEILCQPKSRA